MSSRQSMNLVRALLAEHVKRDAGAICGADHLDRDLHIVPLSLALVVLDIEDLYDVRLSSEDLGSLTTVSDLARMADELSREVRLQRNERRPLAFVPSSRPSARRSGSRIGSRCPAQG
jgi:acyl carrier protein